MKRKLGRFFARMSGVLRRVWRWCFPAPARTEVQLEAPRPPEPAPAVTREIVDLEFEEIRQALLAEPSRRIDAAPRLKPVVKVAAPVEQAPPEEPLADTAVADLLARIDSFSNMGEPPTLPPEAFVAVEPELLVEEPPVRQQIVEQMIAETAAVAPTLRTGAESTAEVLAADDASSLSEDVAPPVIDEADRTDAADEATLVEAAAEAPIEEPFDEPLLETVAIDETLGPEPTFEGDAELDAELDAAMAQADEANTAFATTHPEAQDEAPVAAASVDDDPVPMTEEPWSPPPVVAEAYYEYDLPPAPAAEEPVVEAPLAPEVVAMAAEEDPLPPEVAAMVAEEMPAEAEPEPEATPEALAEATIDAVTAAVEETLAAADTLEGVEEAIAEMPSDADGLAAAAMADIAATVEAAQEAPAEPEPGPFRNPLPKVEIPSDYVATPESMHALYQLQLGGFEGPLDLLLHLIRRHHLDIFDIPIAFICERYLEYIKAMEDLDIDVASEFLFMAAELLHLKSRMLLPRPEGEATDEEEIDPRAELVRRLLEYQKYKDAAERFGLLDRFGRDTFGRDAEPAPPLEGEAPLKEVGLFALVKAFQACLDRQKPEVRHQVMLEQVSVRQRIRTLVQRFESQEPTRFDVLLEDTRRRIDIVVTFLALLEMGKLKLLRIFQNDEGVIYVHPKFDDVSLAFARLEGLDESQYAG